MRHPLFSEQYAHAMAERTETFIEEMLSIADSVDEDPKSRAVRIDTRKWIASKLKPKKYGDLIRQEHSGPGGDSIQINIAPVVHVVTGAPQQAAIEAEIISETKQIEPSKDQ